MAVTPTPAFTQTPFIALAQVATGNTARDGSGSPTTVTAGTTNGRRIDRIYIKATVTTTAGMVRLFIDDGVNVRLWREVPVSAITVSASAAGFETAIGPTDPYAPLLVLPSSSYILKATTHNSEAINVIASGGDL